MIYYSWWWCGCHCFFLSQAASTYRFVAHTIWWCTAMRRFRRLPAKRRLMLRPVTFYRICFRSLQPLTFESSTCGDRKTSPVSVIVSISTAVFHLIFSLFPLFLLFRPFFTLCQVLCRAFVLDRVGALQISPDNDLERWCSWTHSEWVSKPVNSLCTWATKTTCGVFSQSVKFAVWPVSWRPPVAFAQSFKSYSWHRLSLRTAV